MFKLIELKTEQEDRAELHKQFEEIVKETFPDLENYNNILNHEQIPLKQEIVPKNEQIIYAREQLNKALEIKENFESELAKHGIWLDKYSDDGFNHPDKNILLEVRREISSTPSYGFKEEELLPHMGFFLMRKIYTKLLKDTSELDRQVGILVKGERGESLTSKYFSLFEDKYHIINNIIIPIADSFAKSSEIDTFIITPKGIFICEIKNWGNEDETIIIGSDGKWYRQIKRKKTPVSSPVEQNTRHRLATEKYLKQFGIECELIPLIVIANNKTNIENNSNNVVIRMSEVYNYIENYNLPETLSKQTQNQILNILDSCEKSEKKFPAISFNMQEEYYNEYFRIAFDIIDKEMSIKRQCAEVFREHVKHINKRNKKNWTVLLTSIAIIVIILIVKNWTGIKFMIGFALLGIIAGGFGQK